MKRAFLTVTLAIAACVVGIAQASAATRGTVYNAIDVPQPVNLPSIGAEAYAYQEVGDEVTFDTTKRTLNTVSVMLSSWACQQGQWNHNDCFSVAKATYDVPLTVTIYDASTMEGDGTFRPGDLLTRATKTFSIPYRPRANLAHCRGADLGKWWNAADSTCYNGKGTTVTWNFGSLGLELPDTAVITFRYNTTHNGPHPIGEAAACYGSDAGCAYDALNVALSPDVYTGSKPHPGTLFQNTSWAGGLCDGTAVTGVLNLDSPTSACWAGYNPAISVVAH